MKTSATHTIRSLTTTSIRPLLAAFLLYGCSGELEDRDVFEMQVEPGVGAKGVTAAGKTPTNPTMPSNPVSPASPVSPATSTAPTSTAPGPTTGPATTEPAEPSGGLSAECADVETRIFKTRCVGGACHGEPGIPAGTYSDLVSPANVAATVKDVPAKSNCTSLKLVDSSNPANSALLKVLTAVPQPCTSFTMPVGVALTEAEIACVSEWVYAVAAGEI